MALEALKGEKSIAQISAEYEVHGAMITKWKKHLQENITNIFIRKNEREPDDKQLIDRLYRQIGRTQMEIDWLKKSSVYRARTEAVVH